ncbi:methyl-accepting chemotaxis protein [Desulfitispora alkaliphila]|uniref:methyl-accepting chemotaxis protein n=1 Tax=Desulfitispora alkaliphila TaxID=622674 RepID=UPI003D2192D9
MDNYLTKYVDLTEELTNVISRESGFPVVICIDDGKIISAKDKSRIGNTHAGAARILAGETDEISITEEDVEEFAKKGQVLRAGHSQVIKIDGERIGTIGITGDVTITRPIAKVAAHSMAYYIASFEEQVKRKKIAGEVAKEVQASVHELSAATEELYASMEKLTSTEEEINNTAQQTKNNLKETDKIIHYMHKIAKQTNMLGLNASIEATKAGVYGQSFSVVADEVRKLAADSSQYADKIAETLNSFKDTTEEIAAAIEINSKTAGEQAEALNQLNQQIEGIQAAMEKLLKTNEDL